MPICILLYKTGTIDPFECCLAMHGPDAQSNRMFKPIVSMTVAAAIAGLFAFATAAVPQANASVDTLPQASVKGDRLPLHARGAACSQHGWPDFERRCQFDFRNPASETRTVRVIALR